MSEAPSDGESLARRDDESMSEYRGRLQDLAWNRRLDVVDTLAKAGDVAGAIGRLVELLRRPPPAKQATGKAEPPPGWSGEGEA